MSVKVLLVYIMRVIARDYFYIVFPGEFYQNLVHFILLRNTMPLKFHIIILLKNIQPPFKFIFSFGLALFQDSLRYQGAKTTCGGNEAFMMFMNKFLIYPRIF